MHIFHLEDDVMLAELLRVSLTAFNPSLKLNQVISSDEAVLYITDHLSDIDLYILDIRVPGKLDGLQVAEFIRTQGATRPIVMTSAYRKPHIDMIEKHNLKWMAKPWMILEMNKQLMELYEGNT